MNTGHPEAEMIFQPILQGVAESYVIASDLDDATLRNALAALSVFRGPGQLARSVATAIISDELASRDERRLQCIRARLDYARDCARCNRDQNISLDMDPFEIEALIEALGRLETTGTPAPAILQK